jgi:hypothetical protein
MGIREEIKNASSESEIISLLSKGNKFEMASEVTRRSWKSTARFRLSELSNSVAAQIPEKPVASKKIKNKNKK